MHLVRLCNVHVSVQGWAHCDGLVSCAAVVVVVVGGCCPKAEHQHRPDFSRQYAIYGTHSNTHSPVRTHAHAHIQEHIRINTQKPHNQQTIHTRHTYNTIHIVYIHKQYVGRMTISNGTCLLAFVDITTGGAWDLCSPASY